MNTLHATHSTYATDEYNIFRSLRGNRDLNAEQVKKLTKAIAVNPLLTKDNPIKVNEKMEVIDGQHRLAAHKTLAEDAPPFPIYYTIVEGLTVENARLLNSGQKPWNPDNYAETYACAGNINYKIFQTFRKLYGLNHQILMAYLSPLGRNTPAIFKEGSFEVMNEKLSHKLCEQLADVGEHLPLYHWKNRGFALSFLDAAMSENYDHKRMLEQMAKYGEYIKDAPLKNSEQLPAIQHVYNKGRTDKVNLV